MLDSKSALIFCISVAFSLLSASVPQVVAMVPKVPILLPITVAETSNPAEMRAPKSDMIVVFSKLIRLSLLLTGCFSR